MDRPPTPIELKVAKAIWECREFPFPPFVQQTWDQGTLIAQEATLALARAAIRAMYEPTEDMLWAAHDVPVGGPSYVSGFKPEMWSVMIDTASPPIPR